MIIDKGTVVRNHDGDVIWTLDAAQADAVAWFREHMAWAYRESAVAKGARAQMRLGAMPDEAIEWACHDVVVSLMESDWRE